MHCLGAVTSGTPSPNGIGSRGGILSVYRALGVLVCEGRIRGPPRGYTEGPHCAPPLQPLFNGHVCKQDNYLCDRYSLLIREMTDRATSGSSLCVEVLLCSDCSCGLTKATSKNPISTVPSSSISPWQHTSELLLEYWCICIVPNRGPETMNFQGLYQAVRSRLHFSQVAAWWSRSNGNDPSYIATRVVPYNEDNLTRFRETPVEHTFPLAGNADGHSIKVTVWALPRMEEVPILSCPLHPLKDNVEGEVTCTLTPVKAILAATTSSPNPENLVLPALVDDRMQSPCNKAGKHHCSCEDEDSSPPSPSILRATGERKRRRSLPCGPGDPSSPAVSLQSPLAPLPPLQECAVGNSNVNSSHSRSVRNPWNEGSEPGTCAEQTRKSMNTESLECHFRMQLTLEDQECNTEKRYKRSIESQGACAAKSKSSKEAILTANENMTDQTEKKSVERGGSFMNYIPFHASLPWSFVESWNNTAPNNKYDFQRVPLPKEARANDTPAFYTSIAEHSHTFVDARAPLHPLRQPSPPRESNPGPSSYHSCSKGEPDISNSACSAHGSYSNSSANRSKILARSIPSGKNGKDGGKPAKFVLGTPAQTVTPCQAGQRVSSNKDICGLMSNLSLPDDKEKSKDEGGILEWFSRVPGRMLGVAPSYICKDERSRKPIVPGIQSQGQKNEIKFKNGNLELSQREFHEVLAVLRARTPSGRKRAAVRTVKRRDNRLEKSEDDSEKINPKLTMNFDGSENPAHLIANRGQAECCISQKTLISGVSSVAHSSTGYNCEDCGKRIWKGNEPHLCVSTVIKNLYNHKSKHYSPNNARDRVSNSKLTNGEEKCKMLENQASDTVDCLRNVSNKADVLLGAILRTSKDKKIVSSNTNKSKAQTTHAMVNCQHQEGCQSSAYDDSSLAEESHTALSVSSASHEDEKSSPLTFNKSFHRFRQFFKKEQENKLMLSFPEEHCSSTANHLNNTYAIQSALHEQKSKVKRKIDFSNLRGSECSAERSEPRPEAVNTNNAHQYTCKYDINDDGCGTQGRRFCKVDPAVINCQDDRTLIWKNSKGRSAKKWEECDGQKDASRNALHEFASTEEVLSVSASQNGHSSSKMWGKRYRDDTMADEATETPDKTVPSAIEQERFRRSLENAASMVFHSRTGLPLTSSPAPLRRGSCCFDYDSSLNSVSSKRNALFELNTPPSPGAVSLEETDRETEYVEEETPRKRSTSRGRPQSLALLGSFEESALNGRLEPVSTVHGFTAEIGASGSFCPKHRKLPVTVFFYTLGDNDKVSTPYLAHINLGKKGYQVPRSGTIQVTLLNPLGTVVKMFVVLYDLSDMPPRSQTFLRQKTLRDKTLRYLVHLRFMSGKSGRIYLHTDIRMIICRKSDVDTASDFGSEPPKELRSYIHGPTNPKFSPRC